jgi:hypothetical protein
LTDANGRCEVKDNVDTVKGLPHSPWIAYVASQDLDLSGKVVRDARRMHLGREVVEHTDPMTCAKQSVCQMRAYKTGAARD